MIMKLSIALTIFIYVEIIIETGKYVFLRAMDR